MTVYNTNNPIGSIDPRDLLDNAQNLDEALLTESTTFVDRLGRTRVSWEGAIKYSVLSETYSAGLEVTTRNQIIFSAGEWWAISGATALPYITTGAGMPEGGAFVSVGDAALRQELAAPGGVGLVGNGGICVDTLSDLLTAEWPAVGMVIETTGRESHGDGGGNRYRIAPAATHVADDGRYINLPGSGLQAVAIDNLKTQAGTAAQFGVPLENSPFGLGGYKQLVGQKFDGHYGFGSVIEVPGSTKWLCVYRKSTTHAITDGSEMRVVESFDHGESWVNDRLLYSNPLHDARPDPLSVMANGRIGFFLNRQDEGTTHFSPLFFYTDDGGSTFSSYEVPTSAPYTFAAVGGIISFPTSQGGDDVNGFISFGTLNAGEGIDYFYTIDNGNSWSIGFDAGFPSGNIQRISESMIIRLGNTDRWLIYARAEAVGGAWHVPLSVFATTNLLDWGAPIDVGLENRGTPPAAFYDETTHKVYVIAAARAGRDIDGMNNHLLIAGEDAEEVWARSGAFESEFSVLCTAPHWTTGYVWPFRSVSGGMNISFTAGENTPAQGVNYSSMWLLGDFPTRGKDVSAWVDAYTRSMQNVKTLRMIAVDNDEATQPFQIENQTFSARLLQGVYKTTRQGGGSPYTYDFSGGEVVYNFLSGFTINPTGPIKFLGGNYLFGTTAAQIGGASAMLHLPVSGADNPAARSSTGVSLSRKHYVFHNDSGEVGSISTSGTSTAYTTTSDETLKEFLGEYHGEDAISVIKADPARRFAWRSSGKEAVGWGAQTSYAVSKDLAEPGGWFLGDTEVPEGTAGASYVPWGVDQSKRTPYLWAAVGALIQRVEELEAKLAANGL